MHLFTAAYVIIEELNTGDLDEDGTEDWKSLIHECVAYWDEVKSHNAMAARAAEVLRYLLNDSLQLTLST